MAKPLIGPVPKIKRKKAETTVVYVRVDNSQKRLREARVHRLQRRRLAIAQFFTDALEDQNVRVHTHARWSKITPAIGLGSVKTAPNMASAARRITRFMIRASTAFAPDER